MTDKEKLFQECIDRGKNYFSQHKKIRPNFVLFHQEMLKYFGEENSNLIETVYYRLTKDLSATKIFGFDSEQFKGMLNSLTDIEKAKKNYEQVKNKAEELLKALNSYRSEYYYKIEEVYRGKTDDDRLEETGYFKKGSMEPDSYKEERLQYYTEGINNDTLIEIFSYEFLSNFSDIDKSERSYAKTIVDKIEEEIIIYLGDITRLYNAKATAKPIEAAPKPSEEKPEPAVVTPEPQEVQSEPEEVISKPAEAKPESSEEKPKPTKVKPEHTRLKTKPPEVKPKPAEETPKPIKEIPKPAEVAPKTTKVTSERKSEPDKILITEEQVDIVRIFEAMYSSGIITAKTEARQIAQLFLSDSGGIEKFVANYNNQKRKILEEGTKSNSKNLKQFVKLLLKDLKKSDVKDIVEHLINMHFD